MPSQAGSENSSATAWIYHELRSFLQEYFVIPTTSRYEEIIAKATECLEQHSQDTSMAAWRVFLTTQAHLDPELLEPSVTEVAAVLIQRYLKYGSVNLPELIEQGERQFVHLPKSTLLYSAVAGQLWETSLPNSDSFVALPTAQNRRTSNAPPPPPHLTGAASSTTNPSTAGKRGRSDDELSDAENGDGDDHSVKKSKK